MAEVCAMANAKCRDCFTCEYSRGGIIYAYRPPLNRNGLVDMMEGKKS